METKVYKEFCFLFKKKSDIEKELITYVFLVGYLTF